jgi:hypothetical protein
VIIDKIRSVRLTNGRARWEVTLQAEGGMDSRGCERARVVIRQDRREVYSSPGFAGSPLHATDSDETMRAAIALACHDATHDADDARIQCEWDADALDECAAIRWDL